MSILAFLGRVVERVERNHRAVLEFEERMRVQRAERDAVSRGMELLGTGAWHTEEEIAQVLGSQTSEILQALLGRGHSFERCGREWRMIRWDPAKGPWTRGAIRQVNPLLRLSSVPIPDAEFDAVVRGRKVVAATTPLKPVARLTADQSRPQPTAPTSVSPAARTGSAVARETEGSDMGVCNPGTVPVGAGSATKVVPPAAVPTLMAKTDVTAAGPSSQTSPPSCAPANHSSSTPSQGPQTQTLWRQTAAPMRSLKAPRAETYRWQDSRTAADLIGNGIISYYGRPYLAVDVRREGRTIARMAVSLSEDFFQYFKVGLLRNLEDGGHRSSRCDEIVGEALRDGPFGLHVLNEDLVKVAPRLASFPKALHLRKHRWWSLPPAEDGRGRFAIRCRWDDVVCIPVIVEIQRRKTTEPVVKVHFYRWHRKIGERKMAYCGEGYLSWSSIIALADCSRIGAKIALPEGGWLLSELTADVKVSSEGKKFGKGLLVRTTDLPECARQWVASFPSIFDVPLSQDCTPRELDWSQGFPPHLKKKSS